MKYLVSIFLTLSISVASLAYATENSIYKLEQEEEKTEISADELPAEVHKDIKKNYHNATIVHAYKTTLNGKHSGYLVEARKGPKEWFITYDKDGDPENKINPVN